MSALPRRAPIERRYDDIRAVGQGAYGTVYRARRRTDGRIVALKEIDKGDDMDVSREAGITALVSSCPHGAEDEGRRFVHTYGAFNATNPEGEARMFIEMDFIEGVTAMAVSREFALKTIATADTMRPFFSRIANAFAPLVKTLETFHSHGIALNDIHRDNIIYDVDNDRFLFIDFGLASTGHTEGDRQFHTDLMSLILSFRAMFVVDDSEWLPLQASFSVRSVGYVWCEAVWFRERIGRLQYLREALQQLDHTRLYHISS